MATKRERRKSVLQSRWLLMALMLLGVTLGVEAALRLDELVGAPASADLRLDD